MKLPALFLALLLVPQVAGADQVLLKAGGSVEGNVLQEDDNGVLLLMKSAATRIPRRDIEKIESSPFVLEPPGQESPRRPRWQTCLTAIAGKKWAAGLKPIPATVVTSGDLRCIPYLSFGAGDYEFNMYGNPSSPACIEIGICRDLLKSDEAKTQCRALLDELLISEEDRKVLDSLDLKKDLKRREGLTFEVTPETAADASGGWWMSFYDEKVLRNSRASVKELAEVSTGKADSRSDDDSANARVTRWEEKDFLADNGKNSRTLYVLGYARTDGHYAGPSWRRAPVAK